MSQSQGVGSITSVLHETRVFPPPEAFAREAGISGMNQYEAMWSRAKDDPGDAAYLADLLAANASSEQLEEFLERRKPEIECSTEQKRTAPAVLHM